ncbi:glycosyltransferase family 4 protein [Sphingobium sufflavum]|uniref:glycosyltransferase family 4 protein n=1 Tax=Sphingobium sufflavum TaxID=1129547 RepID=UPI001F4564F7|nr:glycosyltransferase family 4 protein [Sphingobium sufflavum]MCE7798411.1 glycosyltransferase family 4 protein [Sphingobium sufflavum]
MKILHVYNRHRGGGGADNAWDATIALSRRRGLTIDCFERDSRTLGTGIGGKLSALANGLYAPGALRDFAARMAADRPDIVHTHELYPLISPWLFEVCAQAGVPVVHSCYDFRITCPIATHHDGTGVCTRCPDHGAHQAILNDCRNSYAESAAFALRHAVAGWRDFYRRHVDQFIVLTDFSATWLQERAGIAPDRINVNECAIHASSLPVDPAQGRYIAFAGRFVPEKGLDILLEAARIANLPIHVAGPAGSDPAPLLARGVPTTITSGPDALAEVYLGALALVVPSLWFETFAIVAAEAMAHGVPVIASRIGALRDTVREGVTGLHFEPGNPTDLAQQMRRLWDDPALCRKLGAAAHADVTTRFSEDAHFGRLLTAYERALDRRGR